MNRSRSQFTLASLRTLLLAFLLALGPVYTGSAARPNGVNNDAGDALASVVISGSTGIGQMRLTYNDAGPKTVTTLPNGQYSLTVPSNWSGTVTPSHVCYTFAPASRSYANLTGNQTAQNYAPTLKPNSGCGYIDVVTWINTRGRLGVPTNTGTRVSFPGISEGPVRILNLAGLPPILAAERVILKANGVPTSFSETMGVPSTQLSTTYWLPWYNNVDLATQLAFGATGNPATVHVYIAGQEMPGSPFNLAASGSAIKFYAGVNSGPVKVVSTSPVVVSEQVVYKVNGVNASFNEITGLPNSQLGTTYWLPWYNNVDLDTQLRIANVGASTATIHVYVAGVEAPGSPFNLAAGASARKSFPGVNNGPVRIVSTQNIVAAERVIYRVNGVPVSFSEIVALPASQLNTTFWLPWYSNAGDLDTQLRIANVGAATATVRIFVGGTEMAGSPFTLAAGASARKSFPGVNNGPVKIQGTQNLVVAERVILKANGVNTSFSEMMALPAGQLSSVYWLPHYNNVTLDTQLRFAKP